MPSDARVFIRNKPVGRTPRVKKFRPGEQVTIKLAKGGRKDRTVTFTADDNTTKRFKLLKRALPGFKVPDSNPGASSGDPFAN